MHGISSWAPKAALGLAGVMLANGAAAQSSPPGTRLDPVLVTASPVQELASQGMRTVTVITRAQIEASAATNLDDLLAQVNGVIIRRRGMPGVQADMGIRGSNFEQVLVLLDGVPLHNPQTGHHNLNVPVPLAHIQRIEIIQGPGALQYGGSGTGGVVNIITRSPQRTELGASVMVGSHASRQLGMHLGLAGDQVAQMLSASTSHVDSEHASQPSDADIHRALYTGQAGWEHLGLHWGLGASNKDFGAWGFYSDVFPDERESVRTRMAWLGLNADLGRWQAQTRVYWRGHHDWFLTRIGGAAFINRHRTRVGGLKGKLWRADAWGVTAFGVGAKQANIHSNALSNHQREQVSAWLFRRQKLAADWRLELGINHVRYSDYGSYWLPSAALSWQFAEQWRGYASWARSARVPSYTELFLDTPANHGNPALSPERAAAAELGVRGQVGRQHWQWSVFRRHSNNLIDWTRPAGVLYRQARNFADYRADGSDLSWRWQAGLRWLDSVELGYEYLDAEVAGPQPVAYAEQVPRQTLRAGFQLRFGEHWKLGLDARRPDYRKQDAVVLAGAKLGWQGKHWNVALEGRNLFDKEVVESGFAPIPGRWFYLSAGVDY